MHCFHYALTIVTSSKAGMSCWGMSQAQCSAMQSITVDAATLNLAPEIYQPAAKLANAFILWYLSSEALEGGACIALKATFLLLQFKLP